MLVSNSRVVAFLLIRPSGHAASFLLRRDLLGTVDNDLFAHEVEEAGLILIRGHRRDESLLIAWQDYTLGIVLHDFVHVVVLQVVNDRDMIDVVAVNGMESVSAFFERC